MGEAQSLPEGVGERACVPQKKSITVSTCILYVTNKTSFQGFSESEMPSSLSDQLMLGWPKCSFRFFHKMLQKKPNELFGQPNKCSIKKSIGHC